jgi:hypothetical protein
MDMQRSAPRIAAEPSEGWDRDRRRVTRAFLGIALAAFALPFLTVTCTSEATTVSGVQAATKIDLSSDDPLGEREVTREEGPNIFALLPLIAAAAAIALTFAAASHRVSVTWLAASGAIVSFGLFLYAFFRTIGNVYPRIGFAVAIWFLMAAAWSALETVPRWVITAGTMTGLVLVMTTVGADATWGEDAWSFLGFYGAALVSVTLSVGAIRSARRTAAVIPRPRPWRMAAAGIVGTLALIAIGYAAPFLALMVFEDEGYGGATAGSAVAAALLVLAALVAVSLAVWAAGSLIVHGWRHRAAIAPMPRVGA